MSRMRRIGQILLLVIAAAWLYRAVPAGRAKR